MNQKFDIIELESTIRPFEPEAKRIQRTINAVGIPGYKKLMDAKVEYCNHACNSDCQDKRSCPCVEEHECENGIIKAEKY